ncbi:MULTISPECIES: plasmid pRiA4b ORF-3 family protein [Cyanophyceae]|uniref:plasmid pRiA4b ORF-3 family protein n=1 Tax=Cyanophyceae TaxID=3028117 RepID=UPI001682F57F|nr:MULTISPECIES: plasmid pRiA4b ORF-3 family protein [Cyanophyceae]MBD1915662.1 plasmid pRiA4b ORF-3 family protein [Phormidium sp. FACHB-77]MBD2029296.1 plasmid pRiA4b ORF-3 family protein [Phormidium sp. FACHB-322]MBD2049286.1 plasmid pRiA4b ORF-3 family protein [Leptolyngbya sp. FACHB-60]
MDTMEPDLTVETYHLHVELLDSDPYIWRQVCVRGDVSLAELHRVLAAAMGWSGEADYVFKGQGKVLQAGEERLLSTLVTQPNETLIYNYAPAQGWLHKVTLEAIAPVENPLPHCTAGERQCPPEFCNGVWDYVDLIDRLGDGDDPEEIDALWQKVGYDFDPERFDLAAANRRLQALAE